MLTRGYETSLNSASSQYCDNDRVRVLVCESTSNTHEMLVLKRLSVNRFSV